VPEICALDALCAFARVNGKQQHKNAIVQNCCKRFIEDLLEVELHLPLHGSEPAQNLQIAEM
jgi:hypothetical protein